MLGSVQLGPRSPLAAAVGDYLARSGDASRLFVLVPATRQSVQSVIELAPSTLKVERRYRLPTGILFRSLQIGPRSGRLYVVGNRGTARKIGPPVMLVLDPDSGAVLGRLTVRPARGRQWYVLDAAVSSDEQYVAVSYHGSDTTGADWIRLSERPEICADRTPAYAACLELHGAVAFRGHDLLVTTGEGPLVELALDGRVVRRWPAKLPRNHLTHFTLDNRSPRAVVLGSCGYTGGVSMISLDSGMTKVVGYPDEVCGEAVSFVEPELLAVGRNMVPVPQGTPSEIDFVDVGTRRIVRRTPTRSDIVALLASR